MPDTDQKVISDAHFAALGQVAASWAMFEYGIDYRCWRMAGLPSEMGACFTAQVMGPGKKLDVLTSLLNLKGFTEQATAMNRMGTKIRGLGDERNRALHDMWLADENTGEPTRYEISAKKTVNLKTVSVSTAALQNLALRIMDQYDAFEDIMNGVDPRPVSRDAPR